MLYHLLYVSLPNTPLGSEQILNILHHSRKFNQENDITGMLLYKDMAFIQLLEGEKQKLSELYQKISSDTRHCRVRQLAFKPTGDRLFADWTMGFHHFGQDEITVAGVLEHGQELEGFVNFCDSKKAEMAMRLIMCFVD